MKTKSLLAVIALILIVIISGCIRPVPLINVTEEGIIIEGEIAPETLDDYDYQQMAIEDSDPSWCEKITTDDFFVSRDACFNTVAKKSDDTSLCARIEDKTIRDDCYGNIQ